MEKLANTTPTEESFFDSPEWKDVEAKTWQRTAGVCERCGLNRFSLEGNRAANRHVPFQVHHKVEVAIIELRLKLHNLVLLCQPCYDFVNSPANDQLEFRILLPDID